MVSVTRGRTSEKVTEDESVVTFVTTLKRRATIMALPPKLKRGKTSHTIQTRVPRYLWHEFLDACKTQGYRSASEGFRESMRLFIRQSKLKQRRKVLLGAQPKRPKG